MYRIEYRGEYHPEAGYTHQYTVKCVARITGRRGRRRLEWVEVGPCDRTGVLLR